MMAMFSHEIRTPLHSILGVAELLATSQDLTVEQRQHVDTITNESHALRAMIDDVLDLSKLSAGQMELGNEVFSPSSVVDDVGQSFRLACIEKGLEFAIRVDAAIPSVVRGDALRLRQVLVNLVSNAVRYTDVGFVRLEATTNVDGSIRFRVSDSGCGIPPSARSSIFEPFTRAESSQGGGTGLGLTITKRLVELMDGALGFETSDRGTSFWCDIVFGHARRASDLEPTAPSPLLAATSEAHILVVDDSEVNRLLASSQLDRLGYTFTTARSGEEALERMEAESFDAVLMDWHMPGLDGLEATRQWRAAEVGRPPLPIITMTASAMTGDRERCLDAGATDYLSKPVSITDLGTTLAKWTSKTRQASETDASTSLSYDRRQIDSLIRDLGDADVVRSILDAFLDMIPQYRSAARDSLADGDSHGVRRCAHTLKSTAAMLGASDLARACELLEQSVANEPAHLEPLVESFDRRCCDAEADLAELARSLRSEGT